MLIDVNGYGANVLHFFGLKSHDAPTLRFINIETNRKYCMASEDFSAQAVGSFTQDVLDGKVKVGHMHVPYLQQCLSSHLPDVGHSTCLLRPGPTSGPGRSFCQCSV